MNNTHSKGATVQPHACRVSLVLLNLRSLPNFLHHNTEVPLFSSPAMSATVSSRWVQQSRYQCTDQSPLSSTTSATLKRNTTIAFSRPSGDSTKTARPLGSDIGSRMRPKRLPPPRPGEESTRRSRKRSNVDVVNTTKSRSKELSSRSTSLSRASSLLHQGNGGITMSTGERRPMPLE